MVRDQKTKRPRTDRLCLGFELGTSHMIAPVQFPPSPTRDEVRTGWYKEMVRIWGGQRADWDSV